MKLQGVQIALERHNREAGELSSLNLVRCDEDRLRLFAREASAIIPPEVTLH